MESQSTENDHQTLVKQQVSASVSGEAGEASKNEKHKTQIIDDNASVDSEWFRIGCEDEAKGRGLFAICDIPPFTLIHIAPCLLVTQKEYSSHMKHTILEHYLFNCADGDRLLALGYGSIFNHHSKRPNVDYRLDKANLLIRYSVGHSGAKAGEELCIYYGNNLWFEQDDQSVSSSSSDSNEHEDGLAGFLHRMEL
uniref:SET domain-containing protein n=1 Tax=Attheya septentrionalis TaxID=420275 RepID=A0A7S2UD46_9STRA|mmetsp:Transcript_1775/g.3160  ORF Transcript_1775/g.3160 Transcript_1775/m.3160 type:complete len:196 (+) Transcript_1775:248-835(+)|eukprot:CAMPEP_0198300382 /NCGR_PEP_ID=MMETSP1449-20131203/47997_1 /TAXON_ID=420275 /ORGANISM="Attheya septentrionalis, Strain CCMP2084" /LENGTH=195 /DNA_ID=CAMNT_0044002201 /DNA_START=183 /DNA_END=770 /DNA_ORIENTATION=-